jgi:hypothetical protein
MTFYSSSTYLLRVLFANVRISANFLSLSSVDSFSYSTFLESRTAPTIIRSKKKPVMETIIIPNGKIKKVYNPNVVRDIFSDTGGSSIYSRRRVVSEI